ncbi:hypothetical protein [Candidatus Hodarchaeum mangrovi]
MSNLHQIIVRNIPEKGLDVVATTLLQPNIDITPFVPVQVNLGIDQCCLTKFRYSSRSIGLRFTLNDGNDDYGRPRAKTHTFIIKNEFFQEKSIQFFISPLILGLLTAEETKILDIKDFEVMPPFPISSRLVEHALCKHQFLLTSHRMIPSLELIQIFGSIDRVIPPPFNPAFTFQTLVPSMAEKTIKSVSLIYSPQNFPNFTDLDQLMNTCSEYESIRTLTNCLSDLPLLRHFQRKLLLNIPEKRLGFKIRWRFGIKAFSESKKTLENEMLGIRPEDKILILEGQFKGLMGRVVSISHEKKIILVEILTSPSDQVSLPLDAVSLR